MKINWNKRYATVSCYATAGACLVILFFCLLLRFDAARGVWRRITEICSPITTGLILAYLLNPLMKWYEAHLFASLDRRKNGFKLKRGFSVTLTVLTALIIIAVFLLGVVPQVIAGYNDLCLKASSYISSANEWIRNLIAGSDFLTEQYEKLILEIDAEKLKAALNDLMNTSFDVILKSASSVLDFLSRFLTQAYNIFLGVIIMIYLLLAKERLIKGVKKLSAALFPERVQNRICHVLHMTDTMFGGFIIGKIIDSAIIGVITLFVTWLFRIPYYPLVSVIVAVTNVIPCFGPFIGAIPCIFIIFVADPIKAVWFTVMIILIQQLDGNYIGPKILGSKTGLSALGVMLSITVMSGLLGITGLFIGVPTFAVLYALAREGVDRLLTDRGLSTSLDAYGPSGSQAVRGGLVPEGASSRSPSSGSTAEGQAPACGHNGSSCDTQNPGSMQEDGTVRTRNSCASRAPDGTDSRNASVPSGNYSGMRNAGAAHLSDSVSSGAAEEDHKQPDAPSPEPEALRNASGTESSDPEREPQELTPKSSGGDRK